MKFCTTNVFKVTVHVKCSNYGICNCSETTLQRGMASAKMYTFLEQNVAARTFLGWRWRRSSWDRK